MKLGLWEIQFPQIWGDSEERYRCKFQWERNLISLRNKSMWQFPWIWGAEWAPSDFEGVFRHFVMNLSDFCWLQTRVNAHGRDNQSFPTSLVPKKWLYLASTFFAPALRGSPHSSQNQIRNKSKWQSDDETSRLALTSPSFTSLFWTEWSRSYPLRLLQNLAIKFTTKQVPTHTHPCRQIYKDRPYVWEVQFWIWSQYLESRSYPGLVRFKVCEMLEFKLDLILISRIQFNACKILGLYPLQNFLHIHPSWQIYKDRPYAWKVGFNLESNLTLAKS